MTERCRSFHHGCQMVVKSINAAKTEVNQSWIHMYASIPQTLSQKSTDFPLQNWPSLLCLLWVHVVPALLVGPGEKEAAEASVSSGADCLRKQSCSLKCNCCVRSGFHFLSLWPAGKWIAFMLRRSSFINSLFEGGRKTEQKVFLI